MLWRAISLLKIPSPLRKGPLTGYPTTPAILALGREEKRTACHNWWNLCVDVLPLIGNVQDTFNHDKGQTSPLDSQIFSSGFLFFSRFSVWFIQQERAKCGENCPISGRRKMRRLWPSWFFRSLEMYVFGAVPQESRRSPQILKTS